MSRMPNPSSRSVRRGPRPSARRALLVVVALGPILAAACSSGDDDGAAGTTAPTIALPSTLVPPEPTTTAPATTVAPIDTTAPVTTPAPTTAPATTLPPTTPPTAAPQTTEPLAVQELVLSGDGLGSAVFGADPDSVVEYVSSILGSDTADTGWVAPDSFAVCEGTVARRVDWGTLSLLFSDQSVIASGRRHFIGYEYGLVGQIGDEPAGLRTAGGLTLGSRVIDLLAEFPEAAVNEGDDSVGIPDNFYVSNVFYGLLTGTTADDYVTVLFGGYGCGE